MINLNTLSHTPIYHQIEEQFMVQIASGAIRENESLPGIRTLAKDLGINPNTVVKAYSELENKGIIYSLQGKGYFVKSKSAEHKELKEAKLDESFKQAQYNKHFGISEEEMIAVIKAAYKKEGKE
jgi:GntR family transcriptional regulator